MQTTSELECQPNRAACRSKRVFTRMVAVVALLGLASQWMQASEILDPNQLQASYDLGASIPGVVWVQGTYTFPDGSNPPFNYYFSGFVIGMRKDVNGNVLNTYIAVPMHGFSYTRESITGAGTGNYFSKNGVNFTNLTSVYQSPLWSPGGPNSTAGDIAIFSSTTAVPDNWVHPLAPLGSLQLGTVVTSIGYGLPSTPNGTLTTTGNAMSFNSYTSSSVPGDTSSGNHFSGLMGPGVVLSGAANNGDSGSLAINSAGQIIGMAVATLGGPTELFRSTTFNDFTSADYYNQVAPYAGIIIVNPPTLFMQRVDTNVVLTWSGTFTLQTATNLATGFTDVPGAASPYTNSITADPQRFFRLRLQ